MWCILNSIKIMVIISKSMFVIVLESLVISVVVKVIIFFEFICCSICFGDICKLRKGNIFCNLKSLCVSFLLNFGSIEINLLNDVVSMLISVVSVISIIIIIIVMVMGCCIFWWINQVMSGLRMMVKNSVSNSCIMIFVAVWMFVRIIISEVSLSRMCMFVLLGWGVFIGVFLWFFVLSVVGVMLVIFWFLLLIFMLVCGKNEILL